MISEGIVRFSESQVVITIRVQSRWSQIGQSLTALISFGTAQFDSDGRLSALIIPIANLPRVVRSALHDTVHSDPMIEVDAHEIVFRTRPRESGDTAETLEERIIISYAASGRIREIEVL